MLSKRCIICYGAANDGAVCPECGEVLLAMATVNDDEIKLTAALLLSAARCRRARQHDQISRNVA